jgi:predicted aspartyl protease
VKNQTLVILLDSGSSHTFLNKALAHKLQLAISPTAPMAVKVANRASLSCSLEVRQFEWWIQGHTFQLDAKLLEIGAYDLVLGMDWLERFRPMMCDWLEKWIEFQYNVKLIRLQGIKPSSPAEL